jgi:hypothetical protein
MAEMSANLNIDSHYPLCLMLFTAPIYGAKLFQTIAHDKGKPVVKQGRKAIESPTGDCQAAEGIEEEPGSASAVCFILFATAAPLLA